MVAFLEREEGRLKEKKGGGTEKGERGKERKKLSQYQLFTLRMSKALFFKKYIHNTECI